MERSVDDVIGKLSEIEATAVRIMEATEGKKKQLADAMAEKTKQFDEKLLKDTEEALEQMRDKLDREKEEELKNQKEETEAMLHAMQNKYDNEHGTWSDSIMQSIVRM